MNRFALLLSIPLCICFCVSAAGEERESELRLLLQSTCIDCHSEHDPEGQFSIEGLELSETTSTESEFDTLSWERILRRVRAGQMPPLDAAPVDAELISRAQLELENMLAQHWNPDRSIRFQPGLRRLTRTEYRYAIRDLLGIDVDVTELLPKDESSHGFDNITVTELSPVYISRAVTAAKKISQQVFGIVPLGPEGITVRLPADRSQESHVAGLPLGTRGGTLFDYHFLRPGRYEFQVRLMRDRDEKVEGLGSAAPIDLLINRELRHRFEIPKAVRPNDHTLVDANLKVQLEVVAGTHRIGVTFPQTGASLLEIKRQPFDASFNQHRHPRTHPAIYEVSIAGPLQNSSLAIPETQVTRKIFGDSSLNPPATEQRQVAQDVLSRIARLAYRRPLNTDDVDSFMRYFDAAVERGFAAGMEIGLASILVNPQFLLRIEPMPDTPMPDTSMPNASMPDAAVPLDRDSAVGLHSSIRKASNLELASRLAFFLWSSLPDEELLSLAESRRLQDPEVRQQQVRRMLADPKSESLVNHFFSQWLYLINLEGFTPDLRLYPDFDENLLQAMRRETEALAREVIRDDLSVLTLLRSDHTFLNERLAVHYDIPGVFGSHVRRVELPAGSQRGGILRHASVLTVTSYATRTSPTIRGSWILENLLGTPPPPPPANVPDLAEKNESQPKTTRERLAVHRQNSACATCHNLIDPIGFALENFDALGRWRTHENDLPIDTKGILPDGSKAESVADLEASLLMRPEVFVGTLIEKLTTYAIGRGVEFEDGPPIRRMTRQAAEQDYRFSAIVEALVENPLFQLRRIE